MKSFILLLLLACLIAVPVSAASDYMGGQVAIGGSGTQIARVTSATAATNTTVYNGPTGSLSVTTIPDGVTIFVDGVEKGTSPATIKGIAVGDHTLYMKKEGYDGLVTRVKINAAQTTIYSGRLTAQLSAAEQSAPGIPAPTTPKSPGFGSVLCIAVIGSAAFLAGTKNP